MVEITSIRTHTITKTQANISLRCLSINVLKDIQAPFFPDFNLLFTKIAIMVIRTAINVAIIK